MNSTLVAKNSAAIDDALKSGRAPRKARVMIVDDHELVRRGLAALINDEPDMETCGQVSCAAVALQEVIQHCPDVVVIDVALQRGEGLALIQRIKAFNPAIRVVALAMYDKPEYVRRIFSAGAAALVSKVDLASRLLQTIRRAPGRRPSVRSEATSSKRGQTAAEQPEPVSPRGKARLDEIERQIVSLIGCGLPARSIAVRLHLSVAAVECYRRRIRDKLNFPTATELVEFCVGWVQQNGALVSA